MSGSSSGVLRERRPAPPLESHLRVVRQIMRNNSNTCYLNSTVFTILWQVHQRVDVRIPETWNRAMAGCDWSPVNFLRFQLIGWRQPRIQHDAAEFIQYLMPRLNWLGDGFSWGARALVEGHAEESLHSGNTRVLLMATSDGLCCSDTQRFITQWHEQAHTHALRTAPEHLYIQLPRYRETSEGIVKHTIPLDLHRLCGGGYLTRQ